MRGALLQILLKFQVSAIRNVHVVADNPNVHVILSSLGGGGRMDFSGSRIEALPLNFRIRSDFSGFDEL